MRLRYSCVFLLISIHAPRTGSDVEVRLQLAHFIRISIHAPRTGSDASCQRPARCPPHFNPRSPHGERLENAAEDAIRETISIHAPRTGSDASYFERAAFARYFNPRSPHGERRR